MCIKDTHREKGPSNKTEARKVWIWTFGWLASQINILYDILKLKHNFRKNKVVTGKTLLFVIGPFWTPSSIYLTSMVSDRAVLYKNVALSILVLSTKKRYSSFFWKGFTFFRRFVSKLKYWKRSKFPVIVT